MANRHGQGARHCRALQLGVAAMLLVSPHSGAALTGAGEVDWIGEVIGASDIGSLALSPDGQRLAFRTETAEPDGNRYALAWQMLDLRSGRTIRAADGGEAIIADPGLLVSDRPIWSPDGRWIYYRSLSGGEVQLWRAAADGSGQQRMTDELGDVESAELSRDGASIRYGVGPARSEIERAEQAEYDEGILVDQHVELAQNVFRGAIINGQCRSQRLTGTWFSRGGLLWRRAPRWRQLDFATHQTSAAADPPPAAPADGAISVRSPAGATASAGKEGLKLIRPNGSSVTYKPPEGGSSRIDWMAFVPGSEQLVFAAADRAHVQQLWAWSPELGPPRLVVRGGGLLSGGRNEREPCAIRKGQAVCVEAAPGAPPRLVAIELASGKARPLFDPSLALRNRRWPAIERLQWKSSDGREFTGVLFLPPRAAPANLPLFINYYRCEGFVRGGLGDEWPFAAMASHGIASVCINAARFDGPQDGVRQYRVALGGIEALISMLSKRDLIDPARVGIGGLSFGSEVAMWAAMHSRLIAAVSVASPQFEPASYWFNRVRGRDHHQTLKRVWGLGSPEETPERWKLLSPAFNVEQIEAPVLMQLPEQEARYAIEFHARLSNSPTPVELHVFPDEPHIKVQPRHRLATYRRNLDWFRFWLKGEEDPAPPKDAQYRRWREMKARRDTAQPRQERSQISSEARSNTRK